jgi:hypothetical protein
MGKDDVVFLETLPVSLPVQRIRHTLILLKSAKFSSELSKEGAS